MTLQSENIRLKRLATRRQLAESISVEGDYLGAASSSSPTIPASTPASSTTSTITNSAEFEKMKKMFEDEQKKSESLESEIRTLQNKLYGTTQELEREKRDRAALLAVTASTVTTKSDISSAKEEKYSSMIADLKSKFKSERKQLEEEIEKARDEAMDLRQQLSRQRSDFQKQLNEERDKVYNLERENRRLSTPVTSSTSTAASSLFHSRTGSIVSDTPGYGGRARSGARSGTVSSSTTSSTTSGIYTAASLNTYNSPYSTLPKKY